MQQDSRANVVQALVGNPQRNIHSIERLRFCPQCIIEDRQQFGECYWHRTHQVSCVKICPSHTTLLQESDVRVTKRVYPWDFISAERGIQMEQVRFDRTLLYQEILYRIARDVSWLLNQPELVYGPDLLYEQYQVHLFNKGIASCTKKVNVKVLGQFFSSYYPPDLLQLLHCELDLTTRDHWLIDLIHNNRRSYYPLCHLLLIQVLGCSAENFFCAPAQPLYFGDGPWSCLNPVSDHYGEKRIENYRVTFKGSPDRSIKLIGTFACDCGFVYTREGPDRFSRSQFQITHIEAFGPTWELAFRRMWDDPTITIEQLASQLNISPHKLMRIAEQLNLPLRPKSKKKWKVLQRASANLTRSPHKPSNPEAYRTLWLTETANKKLANRLGCL